MIQVILALFGMTLCQPASTPFPAELKLTQSSNSEVIKFATTGLTYPHAMGSLIYLAHCIRSDISYAVGVLSQHLEQTSQQHWNTFVHVL